MKSLTTFHFEQAQSYFSQGDYTRSNDLCDILLREGLSTSELLHLKALNLTRFDQLESAGRFLRKCLEIDPSNEKAWLDLAYVCCNQGDDRGALTAYHRAILINPTYSSAYNGIAVIYARRKDTKSAIKILRKGLDVDPNDIVSATNLARLLDNEDRSEEALAIYQEIIKKSPTAKNYQNLISLYQRLNLCEYAISTCRDGLEQHPDEIPLRRLLLQLEQGQIHISDKIDTEVKSNLEIAVNFLNTGDIKSAGCVFESLYQKHPQHPLILHDYALYCFRHTEDEKTLDGLSMLDQSILTFPEFIPPYKLLSHYWFSQSDFESVIRIAQEGLQFDPNSIDLYHVLAMALKETGRLENAIQVMKKILPLKKEIPIGIYNDLGLMYSINGEFAQSVECYKKVLQRDPDHYTAKFNYGLLLSRSGMLDKSIEIFESLPKLDRNAFEAFLYAAACHPDKHRQLPRYLENWVENYVGHVKPKKKSTAIHKKKKIRIGYISPDFRNHPVSFFMVGPYANHEKSRFEIYSYYNGVDLDDYTKYLKENSDVWRDIAKLPDDQLSNRISQDQIDILVDLSGHTAGNRLPVFVSKPAPIQVTYLGYLATTGIPQIDYRIIDSYASPDFGVEQLIQLPNCYLCYQPFRLNLSSSSHAKLKNNHVTFGCFHRLPKIHPHLIAVWSKILLKVPKSVLYMKTRYLDDPDIQVNILDQFFQYGVSNDRIVFRGHVNSFVDHLSAYDEIDVMLDAFPYNGTTITCESLWMGVPVVTLAGDLHLSRVGVSINTNAGLSELVGKNVTDYVNIAVELALDEKRLLDYNQTLRDKFLRSNVCDPVAFTRNLEEAYETIYRKGQ